MGQQDRAKHRGVDRRRALTAASIRSTSRPSRPAPSNSARSSARASPPSLPKSATRRPQKTAARRRSSTTPICAAPATTTKRKSGRDAIPDLVAALPETFSYQPGKIVGDGAVVMIHGRYVGWPLSPWLPLTSSGWRTESWPSTGRPTGGSARRFHGERQWDVRLSARQEYLNRIWTMMEQRSVSQRLLGRNNHTATKAQRVRR
jgi:hypothetical protein